MDKHRLDSQQDDADVEPERPMLDVPDVALYAPFHLPQLLGLASESRFLGPARNARFHEVAHHVFVEQLAVHLRVFQHVWAWSHDAHVVLQHVPELRQLVDVALAHEVAKGELAWVVLGGLHLVGVLVDMHGAELIAHERASVHTGSCLLEEDGAGALALDDERYDGDKQAQGYEHTDGEHDVECSLDKLVGRDREGQAEERKHLVVANEHGLEVHAQGVVAWCVVVAQDTAVAIKGAVVQRSGFACGEAAQQGVDGAGEAFVRAYDLHALGHATQYLGVLRGGVVGVAPHYAETQSGALGKVADDAAEVVAVAYGDDPHHLVAACPKPGERLFLQPAEHQEAEEESHADEG